MYACKWTVAYSISYMHISMVTQALGVSTMMCAHVCNCQLMQGTAGVDGMKGETGDPGRMGNPGKQVRHKISSWYL